MTKKAPAKMPKAGTPESPWRLNGGFRLGAGRRCKLTEETANLFLEALARGAFYRDAAAAAGFHENSYYKYKRRGEEDLEAGEDTIFARFHEAVEKVESELRMKLNETWLDLAVEKQDFRGIMEFAARRWPGDYAPPEQRIATRNRDAEGEGGSPAVLGLMAKLIRVIDDRLEPGAEPVDVQALLEELGIEVVDGEVVEEEPAGAIESGE